MRYLDKIRTETRRIFKKGFDAFIYELRKSTEQKIIDRILANHDRIRLNLTKDLNILIANSSLIECKIDNEFYLENSMFYRNLLNCELENNESEIHIIIREIEFQFRDLSIKSDRIKFEYNELERKKINEEIEQKIAFFTKNLEDYLKAILVYKHFNKNASLNQTTEIQSNTLQKKRVIMKPGRKKISEMDVYALKYVFISQLYDDFNPEKGKNKYQSMDDFYKIVSKFEGLNPTTFSNSYKKLRYINLESYCNKSKAIFNSLIENHDFKDYPLIQDWINKHKVRINSN